MLSKVNKSKLKILFVSANPAKDLNLDSEHRAITEVIRASKYRDRIEIVTQLACRYNDLIDAMNREEPDIIHFSGHGTGEEGLVFADPYSKTHITLYKGTLKEQKVGIQKVSGEILKDIFSTANKNLRFIFINACHSKEQAKEIVDEIDFAIGMERAIKDTTAIIFAKRFYQALTTDITITNSFKQARNSVGVHAYKEVDIPLLFIKDDANDFKLSDIISTIKPHYLIAIVGFLILLLVVLFTGKSIKYNTDSTKIHNGDSEKIGHDKNIYIYNASPNDNIKAFIKRYNFLKYPNKKEDIKSHFIKKSSKHNINKIVKKGDDSLEKNTKVKKNLQNTLNSLTPKDTNLQKAIEIFNNRQIKQSLNIEKTIQYLEYIRRKNNRQKIIDEAIKSLAKELKFEAQILAIKHDYNGAKKRYKEMIKYDRSPENLFEYANFLEAHSNIIEAIKLYEEVSEIYKCYSTNPSIEYKSFLVIVFSKLGKLYSEQHLLEKAIQNYESSLRIYRSLSNRNPSIYRVKLMMNLNIISSIYLKKKDYKKALDSYSELIIIQKNLFKKNSSVYGNSIADTFNKIGFIYSIKKSYKDAIKAYKSSLKIYKNLFNKNPIFYREKMATLFETIARLYHRDNDNIKAQIAYKKVLNLYKELLKNNQKVYEMDYVKVLLEGVEYFHQNPKLLKEAQIILSKVEYKDSEIAQKLLIKIKDLRDKKSLSSKYNQNSKS